VPSARPRLPLQLILALVASLPGAYLGAADYLGLPRWELAPLLAAMRDGWRVIQIPQQFPAYPGMELTTSFVKFEHVLEKIEEIERG